MIFQTMLGTYIDLSKIVSIGQIIGKSASTAQSYVVTVQLSEPLKIYQGKVEQLFHHEIAESLQAEHAALRKAGDNKAARIVFDKYDAMATEKFVQSHEELLKAWADYKASRSARVEALLARLEGSSDKDAIALLNALG